jgi:hypothetical protein
MRIFKHFNKTGNQVCPICKTNEDKEVVLVKIIGTEKDNICQAIQVHLDCLDLSYVNNNFGTAVYQIL